MRIDDIVLNTMYETLYQESDIAISRTAIIVYKDGEYVVYYSYIPFSSRCKLLYPSVTIYRWSNAERAIKCLFDMLEGTKLEIREVY